MEHKNSKSPGKPQKQKLLHHGMVIALKSVFWFWIGMSLGIFLVISFLFIYFQNKYTGVVYPGITIGGINLTGLTKNDVKELFLEKNKKIGDTTLVFTSNNDTVSIKAKDIDLGYDAPLLSEQAFLMGRSKDTISNISLVFQSYLNDTSLPPSYNLSQKKFEEILLPLSKQLTIEPKEALFTFENGKVSAFRTSENGQAPDMDKLAQIILEKTPYLYASKTPLTLTFSLPVNIVEPKIRTDQANNFGIRELIATGSSQFQGSIPNRIYNITLASQRLNGILVAPNETFSFNKALGDVSQFTGYKQAYVIQNGRTVLGDGGGVCQVSTTFFRALLNGGLPIVERHSHAYRVGYYEQNAPPGFDATVYVPTIDLRFKNDTGSYILIQNVIDPVSQQLTFTLYGTKDNREVTISKPVISNQAPPPEPAYQDDSTLPKGIVKQVDFAAPGANVVFTREVKRGGKTIISEKYISNYLPWRAVYLKGTHE